MTMSAGIVGFRQTWQKNISADTDANLASHLSSAPTTRPIRVDVSNGTTMGGVASAALSAGDLSSFLRVNLKVKGNVYGYGGAGGAANSGTGGTGGTAIDANGQSNLTIDLDPGGEIRGGGGGGGGGGLGANGDNPNWSYLGCSANSPDIYWQNYYISQTRVIYPDSVVAWNQSTDANMLYKNTAGYHWKRTTWTCLDKGVGVDQRHGVYRTSSLNTTYGGNGGAGGVGQGYNQSAGGGSAGSGGGTRAGTGGTGGSGAAWASVGSGGNTGGTGYYHSTYNLSTSRSGTGGGSGGAAGAAITNTTGVTFNNNGGTISGSY